MTYHTKNYFYLKIKKITLVVILIILILFLALGLVIKSRFFGQEIISPVSEVTPIGEGDPKSLITYDEWGYPKDINGNWIENDEGFYGPLDTRREHLEGEASWYSVDGCLGCNPSRIMANGQRLDDNAYTIACNDYLLGTKVLVKNTENDLFVEAVVTDTGGFGKYGRVADLSKATKEAIGCGGLCQVEIFKVN